MRFPPRHSVVFFYLLIICMLTSCGFPGPIFKYNNQIEEFNEGNFKTTQESWDYFCFDKDGNFKCQLVKRVEKDTMYGSVVHKTIKSTELSARGRRKRTVSKSITYDSKGEVISKLKEIERNSGALSETSFLKEILYSCDGVRKTTVEKNKRRNLKSKRKIRYKGVNDL